MEGGRMIECKTCGGIGYSIDMPCNDCNGLGEEE